LWLFESEGEKCSANSLSSWSQICSEIRKAKLPKKDVVRYHLTNQSEHPIAKSTLTLFHLQVKSYRDRIKLIEDLCNKTLAGTAEVLHDALNTDLTDTTDACEKPPAGRATCYL